MRHRDRCSWTLTALVAGVIAFYASARSLQIGNGVEVIALTSVTANLTAIIGGILVFHEPIGSGALEITARFLAFCLVIAGAALMPAPMRATPTRASTSPVFANARKGYGRGHAERKRAAGTVETRVPVRLDRLTVR